MKYPQHALVAGALICSCARPQHRGLEYYEARLNHADLRQSILNMQSEEAMGELGFEPSASSLKNLRKSDLLGVTSENIRRVLVYDYPSRGTMIEFSYSDHRFSPVEIEAAFGLYQPKLFIPKSYTEDEFFNKFARLPVKVSPNAGLRQSFSGVPSNAVLQELDGTLTINVDHDGLIEYVHLYLEKGQIAGISLTPDTELD